MAEGIPYTTVQFSLASGGAEPYTYSTDFVDVGTTLYSEFPQTDNNPPRIVYTGGPISFNASDYTYTVTDDEGDTATLPFRVQVFDNINDIITFDSVYPNNVALSQGTEIVDFLPFPTASHASGEAIGYRLKDSDGNEIANLTEAFTGVVLDNNILTGTPTTVGPYVLIWEAYEIDDTTNSTSINITFEVEEHSPPRFLNPDSVREYTFIDGTVVDQDLVTVPAGSGYGDIAYTLEWIGVDQPSWITLSGGTGGTALNISGTAGTSGQVRATLIATDENGSQGTRPIIVTVLLEDIPEFNFTGNTWYLIGGRTYQISLPSATTTAAVPVYSIENIDEVDFGHALPTLGDIDSQNGEWTIDLTTRILTVTIPPYVYSPSTHITASFDWIATVGSESAREELFFVTRPNLIPVFPNIPTNFNVPNDSYVTIQFPEAQGGNIENIQTTIADLHYVIVAVGKEGCIAEFPPGTSYESNDRSVIGPLSGAIVGQCYSLRYTVTDADGDRDTHDCTITIV